MLRKYAALTLFCLVQSAPAAELPARPESAADRETQCRHGAIALIETAERAVARTPGDERAPQRRDLIGQWTRRLVSGEQPCRLYDDIQRAAPNF